jgi:hypothetical protein
MELRLNVSFEEIISVVHQLSPEELEKLKNEVDKTLSKTKTSKKEKKIFGRMEGFVKYMADDFNEPLEDFKDYM